MSVVDRFIVRTKRYVRGKLYFLQGMLLAFGRLEKHTQDQRALIDGMNKELKESERDQLYLTIGRALTVWAAMEEYIVLLLASILMVSSARAGLILYSILNFNVWLSLIHDLMVLDSKLEPFQKRWNKISERIRKIKDLRDRLAHHPVSFETVHLKPSRFDRRPKAQSQHPLDLREVNDFIQTVIAISSDLRHLLDDIHALWDKIFPSEEKSVEPTPDHSPKSGSQ